jgi:hypothetical protein
MKGLTYRVNNMIADFVINSMNSYIAGGMKPETAARFTRGELAAIYKGDHYSRDNSGAMRPTPPPENLTPEATRIKCDEAIAEILKTRTKAPEPAPREQPAKKTGLEGLKNYVKREAV